jgi:hypothetical protein
MRRILQSMILLSFFTGAVPALADPPTAIQPPEVDRPPLARAKKMLDQLAEMMAQLVADVRAAGDDTAKITELRDAFWKKAEGFHDEGMAIQEVLSDAEKAALEEYGKKKITPLMAQLLEAQSRAEEAQAAKQAAADAHKLTTELADSAAVAYSPQEKQVAYCDSWRDQSPGHGAVVRVTGAKGKPEELTVCDLGDEDPQASLDQNLPSVEARLLEGGFLRLDRAAWLGKGDFTGPDRMWRLQWTGRKLLLTGPGIKGARSFSPELPVDKRMSGAPVAVFFSPTQPVIVVQIYWDGGKFYRPGENSSVHHQVIWLPEPKPTPKK